MVIMTPDRPKPKSSAAAFIYSLVVLSAFAVILIIPATRELFAGLVNSLTFGMVLMGFHTITDTVIELKRENERISLKEVAARTRRDRFLSFVVLRSLPFFWIPAHTVAYLLPEQIQVIFLAVLSIVLGLILTFDKQKQYSPA